MPMQIFGIGRRVGLGEEWDWATSIGGVITALSDEQGKTIVAVIPVLSLDCYRVSRPTQDAVADTKVSPPFKIIAAHDSVLFGGGLRVTGPSRARGYRASSRCAKSFQPGESLAQALS